MKRYISIALLILLVASLGSAQGIGFKGVGGGLGYTSVSFSSLTETESLGGFAIFGHAYLGEIAQNIGLYPDVTYFSASKDFGGGVDWLVGDFAINANAHYNISAPGKVLPYVGAGLGINFLSSTVKMSIPFFGMTETSSSTTRFGINVLGGAEYALSSNLSVLGEARYVIASDFNHFQIRAGVTYALK
jgi:opacity protein-like surface antigen